jgi:hypothetical protein
MLYVTITLISINGIAVDYIPSVNQSGLAPSGASMIARTRQKRRKYPLADNGESRQGPSSI